MNETSGPAVRPIDETAVREGPAFPYTHPDRVGVEDREQHDYADLAARYRDENATFAEWAQGYGVVRHQPHTQVRIHELARSLTKRGAVADAADVYGLLRAADRLASAAMWLVVHMTYANTVALDGRPLARREFKAQPEGHTGGSLNMVPAYVGYLAANTLSGITRSWLMGQGHCVAAIDATNVLVGNMHAAHAERYAVCDPGLSRLVNDFYSYAITGDGRPASPLGSHVNAHTAGGLIEGGYLGFAELQYPHMPLPGESLVAFLSDGAFEEQRGSDWTPRWWRGADSGAVLPIMIVNGRRIEERTEMAQEGGVPWFKEHLRLNHFEPLLIDGRDPAAFVWAILEMETCLAAEAAAVAQGKRGYPVRVPYAIAETVKGYGFPGAGTNLAHNLPLGANPATDDSARQAFNDAAQRLWVAPATLQDAVERLNRHRMQGRVQERDHPLARRDVPLPTLPAVRWREPGKDGPVAPMDGLDAAFVELIAANPRLRPRVGNPDELRSNRMDRTLDTLRHRVTHPEAGVAEAVDGAVVTALNEEAVVSAALGNKGGLNLVVTYEAFAPKMLGALRQEVVFARHQADAGRPPRWLSVAIVTTSHTWENGKNELSHQDTTFAEVMLGEMADTARVLFPADWNSAVAALRAVYATHGTIATLVVPKRPLADIFDRVQAETLARDGALRVRGSGGANEQIVLAAIGAYQLHEALRASDRLTQRGVAHAVVYVAEPGRFRQGRDEHEARWMAPATEIRERLFPETAQYRAFLCHTRPEPVCGVLRALDTGRQRTRWLGFANRGGTLDTPGMLFANRCTWAHALQALADACAVDPGVWLDDAELAAVRGVGDPASLRRAPRDATQRVHST
jgi:phosphoketolase